MNTEVWKAFSQAAGIGGLSLGVFLLLFRDVIRKNIFSKLNSAESYRIIKLIVILSWSIALLGIGAWIFIEGNKDSDVKVSEDEKLMPYPMEQITQTVTGNGNAIIQTGEGHVYITTL